MLINPVLKHVQQKITLLVCIGYLEIDRLIELNLIIVTWRTKLNVLCCSFEKIVIPNHLFCMLISLALRNTFAISPSETAYTSWLEIDAKKSSCEPDINSCLILSAGSPSQPFVNKHKISTRITRTETILKLPLFFSDFSQLIWWSRDIDLNSFEKSWSCRWGGLGLYNRRSER